MSRPGVGGLLLLMWMSSVSLAQEAPAADLAEEAELHFSLAVERYKVADYSGALEHLLASNRLAPNKNVQFNIARTYEKLEQFNQAYRHYADYLQVETDPAQRKVASESLARIAPKVALVDVVTDPPGATVYVDRRELGARGRTPVTLALAPGQHTLLIEREGFHARSELVAVNIGEKAALSPVLAPIQGTVELVGDPPGARVHVDRADGPVIGLLPGVFRLPPGPTRLFIAAEGHQPRELTVDVVADRSTRAEVALSLWTGSVVVDADLPGALIEVDGEARGFTPAVLELPTGAHRLRVSLPGHRPIEQEVLISREQQSRVAVSLNPLVEVAAASRSVETIALAPASVSVISGAELRAFGYASVYEALLGTRGVYGSTDLSYEYIGVRGFARPGDYGNRTLVTLDGHTLNDDQIGASYVSTDLLTDLEDLSRIEVVRGPGSALYGSNAVFGVVNLVTDRGERAAGAHVALRGDEARTMRARAGLNRGDTDRGLFVSASGSTSQGEDYYFPAFSDGLDPNSGWSRDADDAWSATVMGRAWSGDLELSIYQNLRHQQIPSGAFDTTLADPRASNEDQRGAFELRYEPALSRTSRLYTRVWLDTYQFEGNYPYGPRSVYHDRWTGAWVGAEPRLVVRPRKSVELTVGGELRAALVSELTSRVGDEVFLDEDPGQSSFAGYAILGLIGQGARLTLGGRYDWFTLSGVGALSPRAALLLTPGEDDVIKLLYGTAFRAPSPYELFYNDDGATQIPPASLSPEQVQTVEVGHDHQFSPRWQSSTGAYWSRMSDLVDTVETGEMGTEAPLFQYTNRADVVSAAGLEAELRREWREGTFFAMQSSVQRTTSEALLGGAPLTNSPAWLGAIKAARPFSIPGSTLATRLRAESPRETTQGTETDWALLWDLMLTGALPRDGASYLLGVTNLLDWEASSPGGFDLRQDAVPLPGRALRVGLKAGF